MDDDTNPLFISAVRIFLDYIRDQNGIAAPEKCSLEQLISYLNQFQEEARTKKGEKYSQSTVRVIRYSLNRVISLGRNEQQMRPYPPQTVSVRKKRKTGDMGEMAGHFHHGKRLAANETDFSFVQGVSSRNPDPCGKLWVLIVITGSLGRRARSSPAGSMHPGSKVRYGSPNVKKWIRPNSFSSVSCRVARNRVLEPLRNSFPEGYFWNNWRILTVTTHNVKYSFLKS